MPMRPLLEEHARIELARGGFADRWRSHLAHAPKIGGPKRSRTADLRSAKPALSHLSYEPSSTVCRNSGAT